jgi:hypothetical protein
VDDGQGGTDQDDTLITVEDTEAPATTAELQGALGIQPWYVSAVTVVLESTDACFEAPVIHYSLDGAQQVAPTPVSMVVGEGVHVLQFHASDPQGNDEVPQAATIYVDPTPPAIVIQGISEGAVYVLGFVPEASFDTSDETSGVASAQAALDGGDGLGLGFFTYTVTATDNAGNGASQAAMYEVIATIAGTQELVRQGVADGLIAQEYEDGLLRLLTGAACAGNERSQDQKLNDFIKKVTNLSARKNNPIAAAAAAILINAADYVIANNSAPDDHGCE